MSSSETVSIPQTLRVFRSDDIVVVDSQVCKTGDWPEMRSLVVSVDGGRALGISEVRSIADELIGGHECFVRLSSDRLVIYYFVDKAVRIPVVELGVW